MLDVHVTGGAGQRSLTGAFHLDSMAMGQVQNIVAHFALDLGALSILVHICDVHSVFVEYVLVILCTISFSLGTYISSVDLGSCHSNSPCRRAVKSTEFHNISGGFRHNIVMIL